MNTETFQFELITPCFCGGAEPSKQAEIRAPSIRGQLRWWFRTLGGFQSLATGGMGVRDQENLIFGSTAGGAGRAGKLIVRIRSQGLVSSVRDGQELGHPNFSDAAYLTFPVQSREKGGQKTQYNGRGVITEGSFELLTIWKGQLELWEDIRALVAMFGHLGALGFRGRRAMGALAIQSDTDSLAAAFGRFCSKEGVVVMEILADEPLKNAGACIKKLGEWLRGWRQHGRTPDLALESPGFDYARRDHNEGFERMNASDVTSNPPGHPPKGNRGETFRPALGLPIIQFFSSQRKGDRNPVNWDWSWNRERGKGEGRFASPILLRPHRDAQGKWHALVIFVDSHKWPQGHPVYLNGKPRAVSLDLYEAMKSDPGLKPFP